ncbi:glycosyltransferase [Peredibacter starrii]|uniref:Glycosyltransferase n=1 Tax=Peredibacter starrii TaxID=28202 RepID=A0AAX4HRP0_9BACT|nr:glycosyltransferase [Peredibacter starrii]WPU65840.1 glycosyltransferase [Peredibacter starrii]
MTEASIIVCTYNRASLLAKTLQRLSVDYENNPSLEVIVVDNNSTDNTEIIAKHYLKFKYFKETKQGLCHARNLGIENAKGRYILFLDDDAIPNDQYWAQRYIEFFNSNPECYAVGGEVFPNFETQAPRWILENQSFKNYLSILEFESTRKISNKEWLVGANIAYRRELFDLVGLFNPNLGRKGHNLLSSDEIEIQKKAEKLGLEFYLLKGVSVSHFIHKERLTKRWFIKRNFWQGRSNRILYPKNHLSFKRIARSILQFVSPRSSFKEKTDLFYIIGYYSPSIFFRN